MKLAYQDCDPWDAGFEAGWDAGFKAGKAAQTMSHNPHEDEMRIAAEMAARALKYSSAEHMGATHTALDEQAKVNSEWLMRFRNEGR